MRLAAARKKRALLSLTSLIDVIFLLLLFFMLSTNFHNFTELSLGAAGGGEAQGEAPEIFVVELGPNAARLNLKDIDASAIIERINAEKTKESTILLKPMDGLDTQALMTMFLRLREIENANVAFLREEGARE